MQSLSRCVLTQQEPQTAIAIGWWSHVLLRLPWFELHRQTGADCV